MMNDAEVPAGCRRPHVQFQHANERDAMLVWQQFNDQRRTRRRSKFCISGGLYHRPRLPRVTVARGRREVVLIGAAEQIYRIVAAAPRFDNRGFGLDAPLLHHMLFGRKTAHD